MVSKKLGLRTVVIPFALITLPMYCNIKMRYRTGSFEFKLRGVLGNKCAGHHNLKRVKIREIV
jgi:hypothetical protein